MNNIYPPRDLTKPALAQLLLRLHRPHFQFRVGRRTFLSLDRFKITRRYNDGRVHLQPRINERRCAPVAIFWVRSIGLCNYIFLAVLGALRPARAKDRISSCRLLAQDA